jgi:hypothetical protein
MIYPPLGNTRPIFCDFCGARVYREECECHVRPRPDRIAFRDKHVPLFFIRLVEPRP